MSKLSSNLADFGAREYDLAAKIFDCLANNNTTAAFKRFFDKKDNINLRLDLNSGDIFLGSADGFFFAVNLAGQLDYGVFFPSGYVTFYDDVNERQLNARDYEYYVEIRDMVEGD
jgi:hypothetical protein